MRGKIFILMLSCVLAILGCAPVYANYTLNMSPGVTAISSKIYQLHMTIFFICVVIGIIVFGLLIFSLIKYRYSVNKNSATFHESTIVELIWTIIPFIILIVMAVPATKTLKLMYDDNNASMRIKVTGYQWRWKYDYLDSNISFFSDLSTPAEQISNLLNKDEHYLREVDNALVLPIHRKIRLLFTANDVIHSWWIPEFGIKKDAIPGFINESWVSIDKPGIYRGQCAELCGIKHGYMPIVVIAKEEADFQNWLDAKVKENGAKV